jgi:serine protease inhibitor
MSFEGKSSAQNTGEILQDYLPCSLARQNLTRTFNCTLLRTLSTAVQMIAQDTGRYDTLVNDNPEFAFKFFRQSRQASDRNVIIAPTALPADFAFRQNGADNKTRERYPKRLGCAADGR